MNQAIAVYYIQGQEQIKRIEREAQRIRYQYYKEFRESICDLFTWADYCHYSEMTGICVINLRRLARFSWNTDYRRPARDINTRYRFYREHGHSITKPYKWE